MERRTFFKTVAGAIAALVVPIPAGGVIPESFAPITLSGIRFDIHLYDYGHGVAVAMTLPDGRQHAIRCVIGHPDYPCYYWNGATSGKRLEQAIAYCKNELLSWAIKQY